MWDYGEDFFVRFAIHYRHMNQLVYIGLGNPGARFTRTRHNLGIEAVRAWVRSQQGEWKTLKDIPAEVATIGNEVTCLVPLTFMNESGEAVASWLKKSSTPIEHMVIIHDDVEVPLGIVRCKAGGSAAGHNGVRSIHAALGIQAMTRLRLGVGRPPAEVATDDYVLAPFLPSEEAAVTGMIEEAGQWLSRWAEAGNIECA